MTLANGLPAVPIAGTHRNPWPGSTYDAPLQAVQNVNLTAWFHPAQGAPIDRARVYELAQTPIPRRAYAQRALLARQTDADPADRERFNAYCANSGLAVVESHWRSAVVSGPLQRMIEAFGATVASYRDANGHHFRMRSGSLHAPREIATRLRGVFGLQQWPRSHRLGALTRHAIPLAGIDVARRYAFPDADGAGQTIAVVQFRGEFRADDFNLNMNAQTLAPVPPIIKRVDNAALEHEIATMKDIESALDVQIIASLAPAARIVIYQAPDDERGFLDAIRTAIFDDEHRPAVLSISYGWPEFLWTPAALDILDELFAAAALAGISVFCSSGDNGDESDYDGKPHVLAPASSPNVHACGATCIAADESQQMATQPTGTLQSPGLQAETAQPPAPQTTSPQAEVPWEKAGGGVSDVFNAPPWQHGTMRALPDVAAQQQPGYSVYLEATQLAVGGTSAVAPVWAALTARLNQRLGIAAGLFTPLLYNFHRPPLIERTAIVQAADVRPADVHIGTDRTASEQTPAELVSPAWNARSGLGVPDGAAIEAALRAAPPA